MGVDVWKKREKPVRRFMAWIVPGLIGWLAFGLVFAGCAVFRTSDGPERRQWALEARRSQVLAPVDKGALLLVRSFSVSPRYSGQGFVYRNEPSRYQSDFYNEFLISPGAMIAEETRRWIDSAGLFGAVQDQPGQALADFVLEAQVPALYGDYQNPNAPQAVLEIQFFVLDPSPPRATIDLRKSYRHAIPIKDIQTEDLVAGWNQALVHILGELEQDLRRHRSRWTPEAARRGGYEHHDSSGR
jgi:hypothetical protein